MNKYYTFDKDGNEIASGTMEKASEAKLPELTVYL